MNIPRPNINIVRRTQLPSVRNITPTVSTSSSVSTVVQPVIKQDTSIVSIPTATSSSQTSVTPPPPQQTSATSTPTVQPPTVTETATATVESATESTSGGFQEASGEASSETQGTVLANVMQNIVAQNTRFSSTKEGVRRSSNDISGQIKPVIQKSFSTYLVDDARVKQIAKTLKTAIYTTNITKELEVPINFDGRIVWKPYLSTIKNQGRCGACYMFSAVSTLEDRFAILTNNLSKPELNALEASLCMVQLIESKNDENWNNQWLKMNKTNEYMDLSCEGNSLYNAGRYIYLRGCVENSCISQEQILQIKKEILPTCVDLKGTELDHCFDNKIPNRIWNAIEYYKIGNPENSLDELEKLIMQEILRYGPISCGFSMLEDFLKQYEGLGIYIPDANSKRIGGHSVRIVGWGTENNIPYWLIGNSWGVNWGDKGYCKIIRKSPLLNLEKNTLSLWPNIYGQDLNKINQIRPEINFADVIIDDDTIYKSVMEKNLDKPTKYLVTAVEKIKKKLYSGSLNPLYNIEQINDINDGLFWAFKNRNKTNNVELLTMYLKENKYIMYITIVYIIVFLLIIFLVKK